ncbi:hypothetical protein N5J43_16835 [Pseudomonas nicosulfuronedens]|uniref:hypothetical protein n=1 Tax=Pseudomonas nicosulfuronedens TaxID=2571105 RepID=UPI002446BA39|nr:hypothetical protein [Pseudomonas nicosulfuronedens]MDH1012014.1 hypothetical protein [Pseudomonas nicosulfuronedens]MDH1980618.1 hypothetical protein [Pseudomonas nicosulfuronedens]MDH2027568.1 hypothetical protein [Pseudomonas nicosulfuronedens]
MKDRKLLTNLLKSRYLHAMGSVMDISPVGDYRDHLPQGSVQARLDSYWKATGSYLEAALEEHGKTPQHAE